MKRLTNENLTSEMKKFHRYRMDADQKNAILGNLAKLEEKEKIKSAAAFYKAVLSIVVLVFFLASASFFALDHTKETPGSPGTSQKADTGIDLYKQSDEFFTIQVNEDFTLKENKDGSVRFEAEGKTVGGIEPLNEEEMVKSMNKQNLFIKEELAGYQYPTTFTLDHQKTMEVIQILHYYFTSPESSLNYHVYFYTPFFTEESADDIARSFEIYKDGKVVKGKEEDWSLSKEFSTDTFGVLVGEKDSLGISGPAFAADQTDKYIWHFFGGHNEVETLSSGDFKVTAINKESGEKEMVLVESAGTEKEELVWKYDFPKNSPLTGDPNSGSIHSIPSNMKFSKPGIWRLDVFFGTKRFGNIIVEVK
ncbi:hypothetical protein M3196_13305 [Fictibacillus nanhaiensis]|uniref:hypothetical protein n=1 Tax=Fictibacillus nanhaiensis TaxID=742169 RepID=UPI00203EFCF2|nr:hypothetical protein [Fictibacillus nanhaiensis]MCM3732643.1 hypothetical protein [Fictibacillus nanhaiensis]